MEIIIEIIKVLATLAICGILIVTGGFALLLSYVVYKVHREDKKKNKT